MPICLPSAELTYTKPLGLIEPDLSGDNEHFFDWLGAGELDLTRQATAMFQGDRIGQKLIFGFGHDAFYLRLDLSRSPEAIIMRVLLPHPARITLRHSDNGSAPNVLVETSTDGVNFEPVTVSDLKVYWGRSLRLSLPRGALAIEPSHEFAFFLQLLEGGLQSERFPERGVIELAAPGADFESEQWFV